MVSTKAQQHRPGPLKHTNKAHKHGRHKSKGSLSASAKGKVSVKALLKKNRQDLNREQRRHQSLQVRQNKRNEVLEKKRSIGGFDNPPFLVSILPLNKDIDPQTALAILSQCDAEASVKLTPTGITHICIPRFKKRYSFILPSKDNYFDILDTLKVADSVILLLSAVSSLFESQELLDQWGKDILATSLGQGIPTPVIVLTDLESIAPKKRNEYKNSIQKMVSQWFPNEKLFTLDKNTDGVNILRKIGEQKRKTLLYRDRRPHLYGEKLEYISNDENDFGTLKVTGYLRGTPLNVNQLIHIPGLGDYQILQIDATTDPNKIEKKTFTSQESVSRILEKSDPSEQTSLESENIPDPLDAEQTWPTEDDYKVAAEEKKKLRKKVPKGWSDYQAAWIPDDAAEFEADGNDNDDDDDEEAINENSEFMDTEQEEASLSGENEDDESAFDTAESEMSEVDDKYDNKIDMQTEEQDLKKLKAAKEDVIFPDEIDTPADVPARIRFQKYRGLESFRSSPWDPKENLPSDYARIFQFQNFDRMKNRIVKLEKQKDGVLPGWYITIHVNNVSSLLWSNFEKTKSPLVIIGLLPHERKMSTVNLLLKRTENYQFPIKSKEKLVIQCGYRRFITNPIYSEHSSGPKHKFERFFQANSTSVATFYGHIQFPPAPVLCFKELAGKLVLVATGNLLSCDPDRLIVKRIILSGHPYKIYKKTAVIRFMFFNREDIKYFKPCKLRTKFGRTGHITEPLGTHGHMKCVFNGQLKSMDTVLLNLYKRVFPKWSYKELLAEPSEAAEMETES